MSWYAFVPEKGRITGDLADGACQIAVEAVARQTGAPSAAYWMVGMKSVPYRYSGGDAAET